MLCQAPTEYRMLAKRTELRPVPALRRLVSAGEPLNPEVDRAPSATAIGLEIHDGYGQTETGALTGSIDDEPVRPGSMGKPLPGIELRIDEGELSCGRELPDLLQPLHRLRAVRRGVVADRRPRHRGRGRLPLVRGPQRRRDRLLRLPDRPVRGRVGAAHPPGRRRGRRGRRARPRARLGRARRRRPARRRARARRWRASCRSTSRRETAPYKYPRIVEFADELPKTASGKIKRAELRARRGVSAAERRGGDRSRRAARLRGALRGHRC